MSIANFGLSLAAGMAGTHNSERQGSVDKNAHETKISERRTESKERTVNADSFEGAEKEAAASEDRDADGRQMWQWNLKQKSQDAEKDNSQSRDTTGQIGKSLDLSG